MPHETDMSPALENYLEAISRLEAQKGFARVRGIAAALSVHKSTVTSALKSLSEKGCVNYSPYQVITLTPRGREVAREIVRRHSIIQRFLAEVLSLDEKTADETACKLEHDVGRDVIQRLIAFADFIERCPRCGQSLLEQFRSGCALGRDRQACASCVRDCVVCSGKRLESVAGGEPTALENIPEGQSAKITGFKTASPVARKLADVGAGRGAVVKVLGSEDGSGAVKVSVKGYTLVLTREEASSVSVKPKTAGATQQ